MMLMKVRITILTALLALLLITPAFAAETTYPINKIYDHNGIRIELEKIVESDTSDGYSPFNYPPSEYKFFKLYYYLSNPSQEDKRYQFKMYVQDESGKVYSSDEFTTAVSLPAGSRKAYIKEYAVYRNRSDFQLIWYDFDYENFMDTTTYIKIEAVPTPTPTPLPTEVPQVSKVPTPTPTPAPTGGCAPFLPLGLMLGGIGGMVLLARNHVNRR